MGSRQLRHTLVVVVAVLQAACAHPKAVQRPTPPNPDRYVVPYFLPDSDVLCVQQPTNLWSCIHLGDLRKLLGSMGRA